MAAKLWFTRVPVRQPGSREIPVSLRRADLFWKNRLPRHRRCLQNVVLGRRQCIMAACSLWRVALANSAWPYPFDQPQLESWTAWLVWERKKIARMAPPKKKDVREDIQTRLPHVVRNKTNTKDMELLHLQKAIKWSRRRCEDTWKLILALVLATVVKP